MKQINIKKIISPIFGDLIIGSYADKLCLLDFRNKEKRKLIDKRIKKGLNADFVEYSDKIIIETIKQLDEYIIGHRASFDLPLLLVGTKFQNKVWNALRNVNYGDTATYLQIAKSIDKEKSVRAVANAIGANAIGIILPCHRIVGSNGKLGGYAGGVNIKKRLLGMEKL